MQSGHRLCRLRTTGAPAALATSTLVAAAAAASVAAAAAVAAASGFATPVPAAHAVFRRVPGSFIRAGRPVCKELILPRWGRGRYRSDVRLWYGLHGLRARAPPGMKKIFETKGDPAITKEVGQMLYDTFRDKRQMHAVFYTYFHLIADMIRAHSPEKDQLYDTIYEIVKIPLETNWNGIGDDEYGWRN